MTIRIRRFSKPQYFQREAKNLRQFVSAIDLYSSEKFGWVQFVDLRVRVRSLTMKQNAKFTKGG